MRRLPIGKRRIYVQKTYLPQDGTKMAVKWQDCADDIAVLPVYNNFIGSEK
jgi:hypothetical protein